MMNGNALLAKQISIYKFELKLLQFFQDKLKIYLPKDILKARKSPRHLFDYVGLTRSTLKL